MMLCKLSLKNIQRSIKDYTIYFLTLIFGVAVFYMFNSLDSQQVMTDVSSNTLDIIQMMVNMLGVVSVGVALVLGFLIVYANNFLIRRRKKEFGLYMTLGMGRRQISQIMLFEIIWIGLLSLVVGLLAGIFGSQMMSVIVVKMFQADMSKYKFVFSKAALLKTFVYFGIMYVAVMLFNTITISRYKLIDLLTAIRKNEKVKMKNPVLCVLVFILAAAILGCAYYMVTGGFENITMKNVWRPISMGIVATFLIFWSLSGFVLKIVQSRKSLYLKGTNMFVLRQLHNKINTTVVSMTVICLLLFMTISMLSSGWALNNYLTMGVDTLPVDLNLQKLANITKENAENLGVKPTKELIADSKQEISKTLKEYDFDMDLLKDVLEVKTFGVKDFTWEKSLESIFNEMYEEQPYLIYSRKEELMRVSDYNKLARLYGLKEYELAEDEYIVLCDFDGMREFRNRVLKNQPVITINGKEYKSKYTTCQDGYIEMSPTPSNTGFYLVPDSCEFTDEQVFYYYLMANYNADTKEGKREIENYFTDESKPITQANINDLIDVHGSTKLNLIESSVGLSNLITFIIIYLGFIFLIASAAVLALKELTETSDNRERYGILRKLGVDESMLNQALLKQLGIFFFVPLCLAILHSVFGLQFAMKLLSVSIKPKELLPSVIATAVFLIVIYGGYFLATYLQSKMIIKES